MDYALISVRRGSSRLPDKCFLELGHQTVISYVVNRCMMFGFIPVVATTILDEDTRTCIEARRAGARVVRGSVTDKLARWQKTCDELKIDRFVTVDCDDPFFDPKLTREALAMLNKADVVAPDMSAYLGSHGWGMTKAALDRICLSKTSNETEMIWKHFQDSMHRSIVDVTHLDAKSVAIESQIRLTLDYEEDYSLIKTVYREIGMWPTRQKIIDFFLKHPGLCVVNLFRNVDWKRKQNG